MTTIITREGHTCSEAKLICYDASGRQIGQREAPLGVEPTTKLPAGTASVSIVPIIDMDT